MPSLQSAVNALTQGFGGRREPALPAATPPPPLATASITEATTALHMATRVLDSIDDAATEAFLLIGSAHAQAHERAASIVASLKNAEGHAVANEPAVVEARVALASASEVYIRHLAEALHQYMTIVGAGAWAAQGTKAPEVAVGTPAPPDGR